MTSSVDFSVLRALDAKDFQNRKPFPWVSFQSLISDNAFIELHQTFPNTALFTKSFGLVRAYGQKPHDRYELFMENVKSLSPIWKQFITEISGSTYRTELARLLGTSDFRLFYWWQYSVNGCSVSPHCDSPNKLTSHIFYFNTENDWKEKWGGSTLLLDDEGKRDYRSAPEIADFPHSFASPMLGNKSMLFMRTPHSWHASPELHIPKDAKRRLFTIIALKQPSLLTRALRKVKLRTHQSEAM